MKNGILRLIAVYSPTSQGFCAVREEMLIFILKLSKEVIVMVSNRILARNKSGGTVHFWSMSPWNGAARWYESFSA